MYYTISSYPDSLCLLLLAVSLLIRHGSDIDPKSDRLLKFEGEGSSGSSFFLLMVVFLILYCVYQLVNTKSGVIQRSLIQAKHMSFAPDWLEKNSRFKD
jgi:hypothetical protein